MAVTELIDRLLGGSSGVEVWIFECADCGETFESSKQPERASCPACLATDVERLRLADG